MEAMTAPEKTDPLVSMNTHSIQHRFDNVTGDFDMATGKLVAVKRPKYGEVMLCFAEGWNIPFATIKLHSRDLARDADAVFDSASRLGDEIARRWNEAANITTPDPLASHPELPLS
jgi:hypothetical protein